MSLRVSGAATGALRVTRDYVSAMSRDGEVPPAYPAESCQVLPVGREGRRGGGKEHPKDTGSCHCDLVTIPPAPPQPPQPQQNLGGRLFIVLPAVPKCHLCPLCVSLTVSPTCADTTHCLLCSVGYCEGWGQGEVAQGHAVGPRDRAVEGSGHRSTLRPPRNPQPRGDSRDELPTPHRA